MAALSLKIYVGKTVCEVCSVSCDKVIPLIADGRSVRGGSGENGEDVFGKSADSDVKAFGDTEVVKAMSDISEDISNLEIGLHPEGPKCVSVVKNAHKDAVTLRMDGYLLSLFVNALRSSAYYRIRVISNLRLFKGSGPVQDKPQQVVIKWKPPRRDILDYSWNEKLERILIIHRESDNALSWLSTLGGAFSALGDYTEKCAEIAGRISLQQLRIALLLGDPLIAARCKLWLALSLIQRGYLRRAKPMVREQFRLAHELPVLDTRLVRMCHGVWAKLQYAHRLRHHAKKSPRSL